MRILQVLAKKYPAKGMTDLGTAEDTLLATLMSAQTTDVQVLKVYPEFRKKFRDWKALANADASEIAEVINSIGLYNTKAKNIKLLAQKILVEFRGEVPKTMEELVSLPGVGRKTASVVLAFCFGVPAIAVDTHVFRIARRLGWSKGNTPEKVEQDLLSLIPKKEWIIVNKTLVQFGREICVGGKAPKCWKCPVAKECPFRPKTPAPKG